MDNRKAQREDQDDLEKEEKWKKLHMQMASSRSILSLSFFNLVPMLEAACHM